jgi:hypothetical protein
MPRYDLLETILDDSHRAILAGDLAALSTLATRLAAVTEAGLPQDTGDLRRLREKAARNAGLLAAACKGVSAARRRFRELTETAGFATYDSSGRRGPLGDPAHPPARRL